MTNLLEELIENLFVDKTDWLLKSNVTDSKEIISFYLTRFKNGEDRELFRYELKNCINGIAKRIQVVDAGKEQDLALISKQSYHNALLKDVYHWLGSEDCFKGYIHQDNAEYWKAGFSTIKNLSKLLVEHSYLPTESESDFIGLFMQSKRLPQIQWQKSKYSLIYLFEALAQNEFISKLLENRINQFIEENFFDKHGKVIEDIKSLKSKLKDKGFEHGDKSLIDDMIAELK